ncbi:MAG TPA: AsmA family protein [Steroidobacteraceae bacterium]|nr:AsmA family protein [Steroidobacteraceae bacterium]
MNVPQTEAHTPPRAPWRHPALLIGLGGLAVALAAAAWWADHRALAIILHAAQSRTGRQISVGGDFQAKWLSRSPTLTAREVTIGNPPWSPPGVMASIGQLKVTLRWRWALEPLALATVEADGAVLHLVRDAQGRANWHASESGAGHGPLPVRALYVPQAHVELHDARRHLEFAGTLTADGRTPDQPLAIEAAGVLNGRDARLLLHGDPLNRARAGAPYGFGLALASAGSQLEGKGRLTHAFDFRDLEGAFTLTGPDLRDAYYLIGLHLLPTGPYRLAGQLERHGKVFRYRELHVSSGKSDLSGEFTVDAQGSRPHITGELSSSRLRLADLRSAAATPGAGGPERTLRVPDTPLRLQGLLHDDWNIDYRAAEFTFGSVAAHALKASIVATDGELHVSDATAQLAGGRIAADLRLDAQAQPPRMRVELTARDVQLAQLARDPADAAFSGPLNARLRLAGEGRSFHEMLASAGGSIAAIVPSGSVRHATAELATLDLNGMLGVLFKDPRETPLRCAVATFDVQDGIATAHTLVADTEDVVVRGSGTVNFEDESLDLELQGQPKKMRLGLHSAVAVRGSLLHPSVGLKGKGALAQAGVAAGLGVALTPLASVLAFVNPGLAHNADCLGLMQTSDAPTARAAGAP